MKKLLACALLITLVGCTNLSEETKHKLNVAAVTAIKQAYINGGSAVVEQKLQEYVADGTITEEQAQKIKTASETSFKNLEDELNKEN